MTILEALQSVTNYPVPVNAVEKACIDRALTSSTTYTLAIGQSQGFKLALADLYMWIVSAWNVSEQNISLSKNDIDSFFSQANKIYADYDDPNFSGNVYGFIGENWNG